MQKKILIIVLPSAFLVVGMILPPIIKTVTAMGTPPAIVSDAERDMQRNQKRLAELRPLVKEFELIKIDNAVQLGRMQAFGYDFDWSSNKAVPKE